jgi:hypothetical protein
MATEEKKCQMEARLKVNLQEEERMATVYTDGLTKPCMKVSGSKARLMEEVRTYGQMGDGMMASGARISSMEAGYISGPMVEYTREVI